MPRSKSARARDANERRRTVADAAAAAGRRAPAPDSTGPKSYAAIVFATAFVLRLCVWLQIRNLPLVRSPRLDSREYLDWAQRLAAGDWTWPVPPSHGPGYPFFLAAILRGTGGSLTAAVLIQAAVGALSCALIAVVGARFFGRLAGLAAGLLLSVEGVVAFVDVSWLSEGLLLALLSGALVALVPAPRPPRPLSFPRVAAAGLLVGLAALVRPTAIFFLPAALGVLLLRRGDVGIRGASLGRRAAMSLVLVGAFLAAVLPVTLVNYRTSGSPLFVQGHGGFNFWIGNSPSRDGLPSVRPGGDWDRLEGEALRAGFRSAGDQDRYFYRKTFREIGAAPLRWLALLGAKLVWTLQAEEIRDPFSFRFFASQAPILRFLPGFGILFPLALVGGVVAAAAASRARPPWLLYGAAACWIASCVLLVTSFRYRLPLVPVFALFGGRGLVELVRVVRTARSSRRELAILAAVVVAGVAVSHARRHPESRNLAEEWSATGFALNHERDLDGAERAFREAVSRNARWSPAWSGLALVAANQGKTDEALADYRRAVELEPFSVEANLGLARMLARAGHRDEAERAYRRLLEIAPLDSVAVEELANLLLAEGRTADVERLLRSKDFAARSPSLRLLLARALGAQRRFAEAATEAEAATRLDPNDAEAWFTLAMLRIDSGDPRRAQQDFDRAAESGGDPRRVGVGRAIGFAADGDRESARSAVSSVLAADPSYEPAIRLMRSLQSEPPPR